MWYSTFFYLVVHCRMDGIHFHYGGLISTHCLYPWPYFALLPWLLALISQHALVIKSNCENLVIFHCFELCCSILMKIIICTVPPMQLGNSPPIVIAHLDATADCRHWSIRNGNVKRIEQFCWEQLNFQWFVLTFSICPFVLSKLATWNFSSRSQDNTPAQSWILHSDPLEAAMQFWMVRIHSEPI